MNATVSGLIETLATAAAAIGPSGWDYIPYGAGRTTGEIIDPVWWGYGGGGMGGSASLCGVPNGCGLVLNMVGLQGNTTQLIHHYTKSLWPGDSAYELYLLDPGSWPVSITPIPTNEVLARVIPDSPLCHVSISKWCDAAGIRLTDTDGSGRIHKNDRCCKIACDMAATVAEIINLKVAGESWNPGYVVAPATATCIGCHDASATSVLPAQQGNMDCAYCHTNPEAAIVGKNHMKPAGPPCD
jgi:hypothetical protein